MTGAQKSVDSHDSVVIEVGSPPHYDGIPTVYQSLQTPPQDDVLGDFWHNVSIPGALPEYVEHQPLPLPS